MVQIFHTINKTGVYYSVINIDNLKTTQAGVSTGETHYRFISVLLSELTYCLEWKYSDLLIDKLCVLLCTEKLIIDLMLRDINILCFIVRQSTYEH